MSPLHPVENFFILSAMGNLILDTPTGCASPVPRHGYRPGGAVHPGRRHYGLMPRRCDTAWPVPMPRVQATGQDLEDFSSKSHPMMMMVMLDIRQRWSAAACLVLLALSMPECLARDIEMKIAA